MKSNYFTIGIVRASTSVCQSLDPNDFYPIEDTYIGDEFTLNLSNAQIECDQLFIYSNNHGVLPLGFRALPIEDSPEKSAYSTFDSLSKLNRHICSFLEKHELNGIDLSYRLYGQFPKSFKNIISGKC